jgi:hypothetical protein
MPTSVRQSRRPRLNEDHSYSLDPVPNHDCEVDWKINGQSVGVGSEVGGLKVEGIGGSGVMSVEATGDTSNTRVSAVVTCPPPAGVENVPAINVSDGQLAGPVDDDDEDEEEDMSLGDIIIEVLKTLGLPASFPFWLLWLIVYAIIKLLELLGEVSPSSEDIKDILKKAGDLLPDWLRNLLDLK